MERNLKLILECRTKFEVKIRMWNEISSWNENVKRNFKMDFECGTCGTKFADELRIWNEIWNNDENMAWNLKLKWECGTKFEVQMII